MPLVIGQFLEAVDQNYGIVGSTMGPNYYVRILSTIDRELLKPNSSVALHKHSNALVDVLPPEADSSIAMLSAEEKPDISYSDIGNFIGLHSFSQGLIMTEYISHSQLLLPPPHVLEQFALCWGAFHMYYKLCRDDSVQKNYKHKKAM